MNKTSDLLSVDAEAKRLCLRQYSKAAWNVLEPSTQLLWGWNHSLISEYLTAVSLDQITRLIINIPPRNMKSILSVVMYPTWMWTKDPAHKFICSSYSASLSLKHSVDRRQIIESQWYQDRWGHEFSLSDDQNMKSEFSNDRSGHMIATSMLGAATGRGASTLLIDDPHDVKRAFSDTMREADIRAFDQTFVSRLNNKKTGKIIVIMQRLHESDLTGHLLSKGGWEHLKIPAIEPKAKTYIFPITKREEIRKPGQIMHPAREDAKILADLKREQGSATFAGQYLQEPAPPLGNIIKRGWFRFYRELPSRLDKVVQSWDMSFKDSVGSDYVCGGVWARYKGNYYLIDLIREKMDLPSTLVAVKSMISKHPKAYRKLIEDKANGSAVMDTLRHEIGGFIPINPDRSKVARLNGVSAMFEAGNVYVPDPLTHPWVADYIEELVKFPGSAHDDQVDMTTQALDDLRIAYSDETPNPVQNRNRPIAPSMKEIPW